MTKVEPTVDVVNEPVEDVPEVKVNPFEEMIQETDRQQKGYNVFIDTLGPESAHSPDSTGDKVLLIMIATELRQIRQCLERMESRPTVYTPEGHGGEKETSTTQKPSFFNRKG